MFLCVMLSLTPERAPKAGPATCFKLNLESKLITPKYITSTYFGAIAAIFNSIFQYVSMSNVIFNS